MIFTDLKLVFKYYNVAIFQHILCKNYDKSLKKQSEFQLIRGENTKRRGNLRYIHIGIFTIKTRNLDMLPSKWEISRSNGRRWDNISKRESSFQNGRVGTYADGGKDLSWFGKHLVFWKVFYKVLKISNW